MVFRVPVLPHRSKRSCSVCPGFANNTVLGRLEAFGEKAFRATLRTLEEHINLAAEAGRGREKEQTSNTTVLVPYSGISIHIATKNLFSFYFISFLQRKKYEKLLVLQGKTFTVRKKRIMGKCACACGNSGKVRCFRRKQKNTHIGLRPVLSP